MAQGSFKKSAGVPKVKGKAGKANPAAKSKRLVNKGKTAVKKGCECVCVVQVVRTIERYGYFQSFIIEHYLLCSTSTYPEASRLPIWSGEYVLTKWQLNFSYLSTPTIPVV